MAAADAASSFARLMQAHKASELVPPNQQMIIVYSDEDPVVGFQVRVWGARCAGLLLVCSPTVARPRSVARDTWHAARETDCRPSRR
jgi:hypothetical protein